jgi:hypothetical protein
LLRTDTTTVLEKGIPEEDIIYFLVTEQVSGFLKANL